MKVVSLDDVIKTLASSTDYIGDTLERIEKLESYDIDEEFLKIPQLNPPKKYSDVLEDPVLDKKTRPELIRLVAKQAVTIDILRSIDVEMQVEDVCVSNNSFTGYCPDCGELIDYISSRERCQHCGKKISWNRPEAHWIDDHGNDVCSNCGASFPDLYPNYDKTKFCPNCGAMMTKEKT